MNSQRNGCLRCDESCGQCDGPGTVCRKCADSYLQNADGTCTRCHGDCKTCEGATTTCTSCHEGFYLSGHQCRQCDSKCESCEETSTNCVSCPDGKFLFNGDCIGSCSTLGTGYGTADGKVCQKCNLDQCLEYDEACQCTKCAEGYYIISDPITLIEICIPCEAHGCISCGANGLGCSKCAEGFELINNSCIGAETPATPTIPPSSGVVPPPSSSGVVPPPSSSGVVPPANETLNPTSQSNPDGSGSDSNSSGKNKGKKTGLIVGVVVAAVVVIVAIVVLVILLIKRRSNNNPIAIRDEVSGEMQQETGDDNYSKSNIDGFNSTDNPIFAANTSENQVVEDPFINDFEEGRM